MLQLLVSHSDGSWDTCKIPFSYYMWSVTVLGVGSLAALRFKFTESQRKVQ